MTFGTGQQKVQLANVIVCAQDTFFTLRPNHTKESSLTLTLTNNIKFWLKSRGEVGPQEADDVRSTGLTRVMSTDTGCI